MDEPTISAAAARNPNERLAEQIFRQLREAQLISGDDPTTFLQLLSQGNLKDAQWKTALEQALPTKPGAL